MYPQVQKSCDWKGSELISTSSSSGPRGISVTAVDPTVHKPALVLSDPGSNSDVALALIHDKSYEGLGWHVPQYTYHAAVTVCHQSFETVSLCEQVVSFSYIPPPRLYTEVSVLICDKAFESVTVKSVSVSLCQQILSPSKILGVPSSNSENFGVEYGDLRSVCRL